MRKFKSFTFILIGVLVVATLLLAACSPQAAPAPAPTPAPTPTPTPAPTPTPTPTPAPAPAPAPAPTSTKVYTLKVAHEHPVAHAMAVSMQAWVDDVTKASNGRIKFNVYPSGALLKGADMMEGIAKGITDVGMGWPGYAPSGYPFGSIPGQFFYGLDDLGVGISIWHNVADKFPDLYQKEYGKFKRLWFSGHGKAILHTTKKPVVTVEDWKGLQIRSTSKATSAMDSNFGAVPATYTIAETYEALQKGICQGSTQPMEGMKSWRLAEVLKYHTMYTLYLGIPYLAGMNFDTWNSLPKDLQDVINGTLVAAENRAWKLFDDADIPGIEYSKEMKNEFLYITPEESKRWDAILEKSALGLAQDLDKQGLAGTAIYTEVRRQVGEYLKTHPKT